MDNPFQYTLMQCRELLGPPPRKFSFYRRWRNRISRPLWAMFGRGEEYEEIFSNQSSLLEEGRVVWGRIIQANSSLFSPGDCNHPAAVIYSLSGKIDRDPRIIEEAASQIYAYKGKTTENNDLQVIADKLANETDADLKLAVPRALTEGIECFYTCIIVDRNHLPNRFLSMMLFPLLVNSEKTDATMILPSQYWPPSFVELWRYRARTKLLE